MDAKSTSCVSWLLVVEHERFARHGLSHHQVIPNISFMSFQKHTLQH